MSKIATQTPVDQLEGQGLDYWMYRHAAQSLGRPLSDAEFKQGHEEGRYQFSTDKALLADLMVQHNIRVQMLGGEWLASTETSSQYGTNPIEAACRLVVSQVFGDTPSH